MSSSMDPKVQKAMDLLKAKSKHFSAAKDAEQAAQQNPIEVTEQLQHFFDGIVNEKTGCSRISFYIPTELVETLIRLEEQGIDPNELVTTAIQAAIQAVNLSLAATKNTTILAG